MGVTIKNIKIDDLELNEGQLYGLPKNPRWIRDARFTALVKSIEDAPEMLALRELLVYPLDDVPGKAGKYIVIGGNMRLRACREIGYAELPCKVLDLETPVKKLREYIIKDNEAFGQTDYDILFNEFDNVELQEWGMEIDAFSHEGMDIDNFFEEVAEEQGKDSGAEELTITVSIPKSFVDVVDEITSVIEGALGAYPGCKVK